MIFISFPANDPKINEGLDGVKNIHKKSHLYITPELQIIFFHFQRQHYEYAMEGIQTPSLLAGLSRTSFGFHMEDGNLPTINYLHSSAPKLWYVRTTTKCFFVFLFDSIVLFN